VTTPISATTGTTPAAPAKTDTVTDTAAGDKDMFMKLLVAQLKYQNPMSPTDGNQYMQQMAVFTQVEKLGQLVEAQQQAQEWQQRLAAEGMVGARITGSGTDSTVHSGVVTKVTFGDGGPQLTLADGSTVAVGDVSSVEVAAEAVEQTS
jgi:flagellar basal-body rod modification protein FlgD